MIFEKVDDPSGDLVSKSVGSVQDGNGEELIVGLEGHLESGVLGSLGRHRLPMDAIPAVDVVILHHVRHHAFGDDLDALFSEIKDHPLLGRAEQRNAQHDENAHKDDLGEGHRALADGEQASGVAEELLDLPHLIMGRLLGIPERSVGEAELLGELRNGRKTAPVLGAEAGASALIIYFDRGRIDLGNRKIDSLIKRRDQRIHLVLAARAVALKAYRAIKYNHHPNPKK